MLEEEENRRRGLEAKEIEEPTKAPAEGFRKMEQRHSPPAGTGIACNTHAQELAQEFQTWTSAPVVENISLCILAAKCKGFSRMGGHTMSAMASARSLQSTKTTGAPTGTVSVEMQRGTSPARQCLLGFLEVKPWSGGTGEMPH